jgi:hypothetical protein
MSPATAAAQTAATLTPGALTWFNAVSIIASIVSLAVSIMAIWLALSHKAEADKVNMQTTTLLADVRAETKLISELVMPELRLYGESMRGQFANRVESPAGMGTQPAPEVVYSDQQGQAEPATPS